jgi:hypothetical protein
MVLNPSLSWGCTAKFEYVGVSWEVVVLGNPLKFLNKTIRSVFSMKLSIQVAG